MNFRDNLMMIGRVDSVILKVSTCHYSYNIVRMCLFLKEKKKETRRHKLLFTSMAHILAKICPFAQWKTTIQTINLTIY